MSAGRVVYVGGMGRSGSTLLERALAQLPGVCGIGETVYMWQRGVVNDERCGCGVAFSRCPFWTEVGERAFGGWANVDTDHVAALRRKADDVKHVPGLLLGVHTASWHRAAAEYVSYYERLYAAVREVSGCDVVVDSSKVTSLAYLLARSPRVDLSLVHILRDPRAVAYSWTKVVRRPEVTDSEAYMPRYSPTYMGALYSGHHVLLEALRLRGVPTLNLRYEDFADAPEVAVRRTAAFAHLEYDRDAVFGADDRTLRLETVHTASGNPSRFRTGAVDVRRDDSWTERMPLRQKAVVSALTSPLLAAYRYRPVSRNAATPRG
ncbi:hypothetical protein JQN72_00435 [Phycicoccus sp. CSK15P-2]|uniref:hypothetical protein n=1 Tax=Phycicoccus sp. CSK15P-2 TaxID=2807627 RepID=UPI0019526226|nr:hypothetical protein [Phycicoccus sp. CSK15P-2]MBM6402711.1 hypothetical protein [Phycicoccus sp. CSK15P-2]